MTCARNPAIKEMAKVYGVGVRAIHRIGFDRLVLMDEDARKLVLKPLHARPESRITGEIPSMISTCKTWRDFLEKDESVDRMMLLSKSIKAVSV